MKLFALALFIIAAPALCKTTINDVTQLNPVEVDEVRQPTTVEEIQRLVRESTKPVSVGGGHFSMGGQTASENTLHIDMRKFDKVLALDTKAMTVTVQTGITWRKIQEAIDPHDLSIQIMQSYANFTVGGSLSVNVHGRYVGMGPLVLSVRGIKVVLPDGSLVEATPQENPEVFYGAIGGYGGLGVIVEASLNLAPNDKIERSAQQMGIKDYKPFFDAHIRHDKTAIFHNGDIYPPEFKRIIAITWRRTDAPVTIKERLMPEHRADWLERLQLFGMSELRLAKELRSRVVDPLTLKKQAVVYRNYEASYDVRSLEPSSREKSTYVLQEYFVPVGKFEEFVPLMSTIFQKHRANVLNVSIRHAQKDPGTLLAWAREESFAFVVYYEQRTTTKARAEVANWTRELIDAAVSLGGSYYLPYQIVGTDEQFRKAYPRASEYFALKKKLDPGYRFRNKLWDRYYHPQAASHRRPEENSFLTLPEWYVVYSADDYAEHAKLNRRPSDFAFFRAVGQFWHLHAAVVRATWHDYPFNFGTHLMIGVVGASFTAEYVGRGLYENTIGRLTEWIGGFGTGPPTAEDVFLKDVAVDYARFIHDTPWYAYPFSRKLSEIWHLESNPQSSWLRSRERGFEGLGELLLKTAWAGIIAWGTRSTYAPAELTTGVLAEKTTQLPGTPVRIVDDSDTYFTLLEFPRYRKFGDTFGPALERLHPVRVEGNEKMLVSVLVPRDWKSDLGKTIDELPLVNDGTKKRAVLATAVAELPRLHAALAAQGLRVEHFYDY